MTRADSPTYIPPGLFYGLLSIANNNTISFAEVLNTILRYFLEVRFDIKCEHPEEFIFTNRAHKTYCKRCWTRMKLVRKPDKGFEDAMGRWHEGQPGKYVPIVSEFEKQLQGTALLGLKEGGK